MKETYTTKEVAEIIAYITNNEPPCEIDSNSDFMEWCVLTCDKFDRSICWCKWLEVRK